MRQIVRRLHLLWRLEATIAEARLGIVIRRTMLAALAGLIILFGLCMVNVSAFFALEALWGPAWAALTAGVGDFALALVVSTIAVGTRKSAELSIALELRHAALDGIETELAGRLPRLFGGRGVPADTPLPLLLPLVIAIVRGLRQGRSGQQ